MHNRSVRSATRLVTGFKGIAFLSAALALSAGVASAGHRYTFPVYVSGAASSGFPALAYGTMGGTRNTSDTVAQIGCGLEGHDGLGTPLSGMRVTCSATDAAGRSLYCSSTNPYLVQSMAALSDEGYIDFQVDYKGKCVSITVGSYSAYPVKVP